MSKLRIVGIVLGAAGIVGIAVGAAMGGVAMGTKNDVKDLKRDCIGLRGLLPDLRRCLRGISGARSRRDLRHGLREAAGG
jgi:hypothetical protein